MQSQFVDHQPAEPSDTILDAMAGFVDTNHSEIEAAVHEGVEPTQFHSRFTDCMEMYANRAMVAEYLDAHHGWFRRCAHPIRVEPIGENGYALVLGPYGSFGYQVEPRIGLDLLPQDQGVYRIKTIPVPDYVPQGYDVDFQASLELVEIPAEQLAQELPAKSPLPSVLTRVEWQLDLTVVMQFPKFIHALPNQLIQSTGERLLHQVVRQISRRLTHKVQEDFHSTIGVPFPKQRKRR